MQSDIKLVIIKDALDYAQTEQASHVEHGNNLFVMLKNIYPDNIPPNTRWYLDNWDVNSDVTPQSANDINELNKLGGTIYVITYPGDPITAIITAISIVVSVAVAFLMPMPVIPGAGSASAPPSPNNALAQRTNRQRLGGRVPAIFGKIRAIPDLVAQSYSVYISNQEIEYSSMCLGEGHYDVISAKDGETSIALIDGANVRIYNPGLDTSTNDPTFEFGNLLTVEEQEYDNLAPKRYSSVNGQVLTYPEDYLICNKNVVFKPPNIVQITSGAGFNTAKFKTGETVQIEDADPLSAPSGKVYNLSGFYTILTATSTSLTLRSPELVNTGWATLQAFDTQTDACSPILSTEDRPLWQGWHYIEDNDLDLALLNFTGPQGIYVVSVDGSQFAAFGVGIIVEVQGLDEDLQPYPDINANSKVAKYDHYLNIFGRTAKLDAAGTAYAFTTSEDARRSVGKTQQLALFKNPGGSRIRVRRYSARQKVGKQSIFDEVKFVDLYASKAPGNGEHTKNNLATLVKTKTKATEGATALKERKLSLLVQRKINQIIPWTGVIVDLVDIMVNGTQRAGLVTSVDINFGGAATNSVFLQFNSKIVEITVNPYFTDGEYIKNIMLLPFDSPIRGNYGSYFYFDRIGLSLPTYIVDKNYVSKNGLIVAMGDNTSRIDDIIYHIAISATTGGLSPDDLNMPQIRAEVDAQIAYFGTDSCAQFCGTFDSIDISTEEMIQTVASAGFFTAYRINNKIHLHFERQEPYSTVAFNSHNIMPDTFEYAESFGARDGYDAVEVTYVSPVNDEKVTLMYPKTGGTKVQKIELAGVRNNVQAHMHLMRAYRKNMHSSKTCGFTGVDESAIVLPTNRIDVANQHRADTQQGSIVDYIKTTDTGRETLKLSAPPVFNDNGQGTLYVQTTEAKVESFTVFASDNDPYVVEVGVNSSFSGKVSVGHNKAISATYRFVPRLNVSGDQDSYLVTKKDPGENPFTHRLTCVNYSDKYYQNDQDFIKGFVRLTDKRG